MRKVGDVILSGLLGCFVGVTYFLLEVAYKTRQGHPEGISWTMLVLALLLGLVMERMEDETDTQEILSEYEAMQEPSLTEAQLEEHLTVFLELVIGNILASPTCTLEL